MSVRVGILMGSDSDWQVMSAAAHRLDAFRVRHEAHVASAYGNPDGIAKFAASARERGLQVLICGAGGAAHLAGLVAAQTTLPVIGVPLESANVRGLDALVATVQMPAGVPVGTVAVGRAGAENAAILAVQILALGDAGLAQRLSEFKLEMARQVEEKDARLQQQQHGRA